MQPVKDENENEAREISGWTILGRGLAALMALGLCGVAYYTYKGGTFAGLSARDQLLLVLAILAAIGFFCLICFTFGICRFALGDPRYSPVVKLLNHMPAAIAITDSAGSIRYMNASYRRLSVRGKRAPEVVLTQDGRTAAAVHRLSRAIKQGGNAYEEVRLSTPLGGSETGEGGGSGYTYAVHVSPVEVDGETLTVWSIADFNPLHRRPEALFEDLQEAVHHLDHAPAGFVSWDEDGRLLYFNATLANWLGLDLAGSSPDMLTLEQLFGTGQVVELRNLVFRPIHEAQAPLELKIQGVRGSFNVHCHIGAQDISAEDKEQHATRRALLIRVPDGTTETVETSLTLLENQRGANPFAEDHLDSLPVAIARIDQNGLIHHANRRFYALFGLEKTQEAASPHGTLPAKSLTELVHPRDHTRLVQLWARLSNGDDVATFDTICTDSMDKSDEATRHIRLFFSAEARQAHSQAILSSQLTIFVCAIEITDQRSLEQQVEQGQKMQAVGQLAGGIAHDFNNVLTAIIMSCDLLLSNHRRSDPSHADLINIKNNANRAAALVRQLLAFSRRQTLRPQIIDLTDMLADARMLLARLVGMSIQLKIDHGRDLWKVKADQGELERVIINLASNAHDAMPQGGTLTIRTINIGRDAVAGLGRADLEEKDYVFIEVKDSGSGIAAEIREKIFDPFFTTKEVGKGTGLGLATVYGIVAQTGGHIYCDSEVGKGTCFSLYLPRYVEAQEPAQEIDASSTAETSRKHEGAAHPIDLSGSATILVVEDEDAVRLGSVKALQSRGYQVFEATTGVQALQIVEERQGRIDLIVSDVVMPEMDGPTLLRELRASYADIKFIFVSGYAEDAFSKNLPPDAQFSFLPKPFSLKQLATIVKEMLGNNQAQTTDSAPPLR